MDEALALPTQKAVRIALRTQQIIAHESNVPYVADPLGGSHYVEWLTDEMENQAVHLMKQIDEMGGVEKAIEEGWFQKEIAQSSYLYQKQVESKERIIVGVNEYKEGHRPGIQILKVPPKIEKIQKEKLKVLRKKRSQENVRRVLSQIQKAAETKQNLIPLFIQAVQERTTLGEIVNALKSVFGEYQAP
jgi:methylmalonyl-CoA mutase N-terminal domain/subunit